MPLNAIGFCEFGPFRFDAAEKTLWRGQQAVPLTPKTLDTLAALLESAGKLVSKEVLIKAVWPDTFVEEGNLAVQISLLRKTLGEEGYIETVPRRGYRFIAPVRTVEESPAKPAEPPIPRRWLLGAVASSVTGGTALLLAFRHRRGAERPSIASVAVLPFQLIRPDSRDEGLGLGLTDSVITRLGSLNKFVVRPTSAVRQYDLATRDGVAVGAKLGVEAVLDGTIQTADNRIRLNVQLIRVGDGRHLWADTFDLERELFRLEDQVSSRLAQSLFGESPDVSRYRPSPEAHRLVTLARYFRNRWTSAGQRKALEHVEQAIALDPRYAEAHALKAEAWSLLGYFFGVRPKEAYPKAEEAAQVALSLDDRVSDAHHAMAVVSLFYRWDFAHTEKHLRRALELNPNNPDPRHLFGLLRTLQHRNAEGKAELARVLDIDPASAWRHVGMSFQHACLNELDAAVAEALKAHELDPTLGAPMFDLYKLHMVRRDHRAAADWYFKWAERFRDPKRVAAVREAFAQRGMTGLLEARIQQELEQPFSPLTLAQQYAYLGRTDDAVRWIEKAVEERQSTVLFLQHPMYAGLRGHAGFQALVRRMGL
jgi:DNA-binding winged helix-turn-helix (wHTH) protein/TolB-like protein/tetratricopeptide (TPR) repeat protein